MYLASGFACLFVRLHPYIRLMYNRGRIREFIHITQADTSSDTAVTCIDTALFYGITYVIFEFLLGKFRIRLINTLLRHNYKLITADAGDPS